MQISFRRSILAGTSPLLPALLMCLFSLPAAQAFGQDTPQPLTPVQKQLERIDFAISAAGSFGSTVSGIEQRDANITKSVLTIRPSASTIPRCPRRPCITSRASSADTVLISALLAC